MTATLVRPRVGTARRPAQPTLGPLLVEVAAGLGWESHAWQRHAADVSLQLARRRRGGVRLSSRRFAAQTAGVMVGRQSGKSAWAQSRAWLQCLLPDLGVDQLVGGTVGPQFVGWLAQDRSSALRAWDEAVDRLVASPFGDSVSRVVRQRGDERVMFHNGSVLRVVTPSRVGPRGLALDLIVLDEALAHPLELLAALSPTMAARDGAAGSLGAQFVALSSAPADEYRSSLLVALREQGRRAVTERDSSTCWLEWSATPGCDPYDEAEWRGACPTLDQPGGISTEFLRMQSQTLDRDVFAVEYLSLPSVGPAERCIDVDAWAVAGDVDMADDVVLAVDGRPDGSSAAVVAAGRDPETGRIGVEVVDMRPDGVEWVSDRVVELAERHRAHVVVASAGPLAWTIPGLRRAGVRLLTASSSEVLSAAAVFAAGVASGNVGHASDPRLDEAVEAAVRRRSGDRWAFDRACPTDLSPLIAASLGVWTIDAHRIPRPAIH